MAGVKGEAMARRPRPLPPGYRSVIVSDSTLADSARELEYQIFVEEKFFPPSETKRIADYAPYEDRSTFHVVTDENDVAMGVVRSVIGDYESLPLGHYVPERWSEFPTEPVCEYTSLAIRPEARKLGLAEELYRSVFALAWRSSLLGLVALVDPWLHDLLNDYYGCAFEQIGPDCDQFEGFTVRPIGVTLGALEEVMPRRVPEFWDWLVEGIEQDEVVIDLRDSPAEPVLDLRDRSTGPVLDLNAEADRSTPATS